VGTVRNLSIKGSGAEEFNHSGSVIIRKPEGLVKDDGIYHKSWTTIQIHSTDGRLPAAHSEHYMSYWIEARELRETESSTILVFVRSTDGKVYLDGKLTDVTVLP
jgi:hypothetical protein